MHHSRCYVREGIRNGRLPETTIREEIPVILKSSACSMMVKLNNAAAVLFGSICMDLMSYSIWLVSKEQQKEEFMRWNLNRK